MIPEDGLPARFNGARAFSTAIYFLLTAGEFAALHRLRSDEVWHFYAGSPLELVAVDPRGRLTAVTLGPDPQRGETLQSDPCDRMIVATAQRDDLAILTLDPLIRAYPGTRTLW